MTHLMESSLITITVLLQTVSTFCFCVCCCVVKTDIPAVRVCDCIETSFTNCKCTLILYVALPSEDKRS